MSGIRLALSVAVLLGAVAGASTSGVTAVQGVNGASGTNGASGANGTNAPPDTATIAAVYPNPVADGDRGEFVVLDLPDGSAANYSLGDGEETVTLPNGSAPLPNGTIALQNGTGAGTDRDATSGRVAVTGAPALVRNLTDLRVVGVDGMLSLSNGGERLTLTRGNETVATARYREAPEGRLGRWDDRGTITWRPLGRTDRPVVTARGGTATVFVLPDSPNVTLERIRGADDRVLLAGYTFTSRRVARALERAADRGVDVRVLLEGEPVDGITRREARLLDDLVRAGVEVRLLGGPRSRYAFHHAKYAVVDGAAVVLTENWKPAGTGGHASRGWGAVVTRSRVVAGLAETFRADAGWAGARPWREFRRGRTFSTSGVANASYPSRFEPARVEVDRVRLLVAPDNAGQSISEVIDGATESVDVLQMNIDSPDQRFLRATVRAARRGVDVRVLLSGAWYVREENRRLVERLRERADSEGIPIEARLVDPGGRFEKVHAKGVVVDGDQVLVGSLNWNGESVRANREVVLQLDGDAVGEYYLRAFEADWNGGPGRPGGLAGSSLPIGSAVAVAGVVLLAVLVLRRVEFGGETGVGPE